MKGKSNCECCLNYVFDDEFSCYSCNVDLDEDELSSFITNSFFNCPYFQFNDEYKTVRKQI